MEGLKVDRVNLSTIMDRGVDTFEQNKRFYPRPCVNSKNIFFAYSLTHSPPFQC